MRLVKKFGDCISMARVTVEDCIEKIPNRFDLVLYASQRARNLSRGEELTIDRDKDKNPVVALREIAEEKINLESIQNDLIRSLTRAPEPEPAEEEVVDLVPTEKNIFGLQDVSIEEERRNTPKNSFENINQIMSEIDRRRSEQEDL